MASAPVGGYYPGTLSVTTPNAVPPQVPYKGDAWTLNRLHCRVVTAPTGAAAKVKIWRNGTSMGEVTIAIAANYGDITGLSVSVSDGDYFEAEITQIGSTVAGADLSWVVAP